MMNPISIFTKSFCNSLVNFKPPNRFNNLFNPNMNNIDAIDFTNRSVTEDLDGVLPRWSTEFPRLSTKYQTKSNRDSRPWGTKSDPVFFDLWEDSKLMMLQSSHRESTVACNSRTFSKGVWYYTGMPLTDHHELAGFENPNHMLQTWLETEFRPQFYINLFNRLMMLDFAESKPEQPEQIGSHIQTSVKVDKAVPKGALSDAFSTADRKTQAGTSAGSESEGT